MVPRPVRLWQIIKRDPLLSGMSDAMQTLRDNGGKPRTWPKHVYCPVYPVVDAVMQTNAYKIEMQRRGYPPDELDWTTFHVVTSVYILHVWQKTQGIYHFDPDLFDAVAKTKVTGKIPMEVLFHFPEWCVYIEFPSPMKIGDSPAYGFFATLLHNPDELLLSIDFDIKEFPTEPTTHTFAITLAHATLEEILATARKNTYQTHADHGRDLATSDDADYIKLLADDPQYLSMFFSLVVYLASRNAEIQNIKEPEAKPHRPVPVKTAQGLRLFPPTNPTVWDVGLRFGAKMRKFRMSRREHQGGTHASPKPHVRSAHYNTYWTGPKDKPQVPIALWIPPLTIGMGEIVPTIHEVEAVEEK